MDRKKLVTAIVTATVLILITPFVLKLFRKPPTGPEAGPTQYFAYEDADSNKWGYIDAQGNVFIEPVFDWAGEFRHERGVVEIDGEVGYIDASYPQTGKPVIWQRFVVDPDDPLDIAAYAFYDGLARARDEKKTWGYINPDGEWVIEPRFEENERYDLGTEPCDDFHDGLARFRSVTIKERFQHNAEGQILRDEDGNPLRENYPQISYGYIGLTGDVEIEPKFQEAGAFGDGLAPVRRFSDDAWSFIDRSGEEVIDARFRRVDVFSQGLCVVAIELADDDAVEDIALRWGVIDKKGDWVIDPNEGGFDEMYRFSDDLAPARLGRKWGYINPQGEWVIEPAFDIADPFDTGLARVSIGGRMHYINKDGEVVWPRD